MSWFSDFCRRNPEFREEAEERAAIMEYDGGLTRAEAEENAVSRIVEKYMRKELRHDQR